MLRTGHPGMLGLREHDHDQRWADMARSARDFAGWPNFVRRAREFKTIVVMVRTYCRARHGSKEARLCDACVEPHDYARRRLERRAFGEAKPTCANCVVHCYKAVMRERVRQVMRWAGQRMIWLHPVLAVWHILDGRRPTPMLQRRR